MNGRPATFDVNLTSRKLLKCRISVSLDPTQKGTLQGGIAASPLASDRWIVVKDSLEDIVSNRSRGRGVLPRTFRALWPNPELDKETGRVAETRTKAAIPVAWTFMSEILTKHGRIIERLSRSNNRRFDRVSWPRDGHECPSCMDWTARQTRSGKRGSTPQQFAPLFDRMGISAEIWRRLVKDFGKLFSVVAGQPQRIDEHRSKSNSRHYRTRQETRELLAPV